MASFEQSRLDRRACPICSRSLPERGACPSSGCRLASRIPLDEDGELPASVGLVWALGLFFLLFNQALFLGVAWLKALQGDAEAALALRAVGLWAGGAWAVFAACLLLRERRMGLGDVFFMAALLVGWGFAWRSQAPSADWASLGGNLLFAGWMGRGLARRALSKKRETAQT